MSKINQFLTGRLLSGKLLLMALLALSLTACDDDDDNTAELPDLLTIARTQANLEFFVAAVEYAGLEDELATMEGITVFAPGNDAFRDAFDVYSVEEIEEGNIGTPEYVHDNLLQHIINVSRTYGELSGDVDAADGGVAEYDSLLDFEFSVTKSNEIQKVYAVKFEDGLVRVYPYNPNQGKSDKSAKVQSDIEFNDGVGKNGVLHIIDDFMYGNAYYSGQIEF